MTHYEHAVANAHGNVSISSVVDCPPIEQSVVRVMYPGAGPGDMRTQKMQRAVHFDRLYTVVVHELSPPPPQGPMAVRSPRDALRWAYHQYRRAEFRPLEFAHPVLDTRKIAPGNFSHLLHDLIPLCLRARECLGPDVAFVLETMPGGMHGRFGELLSFFGIEPIVTQRPIIGPIVHHRGARGLSFSDIDTAHDCHPLMFYPDTYKSYNFTTKVAFDKIFIARKGLRRLENHTEVEQLLVSYGYKTIFMEDYTVRDQLSIGANAKYVVAPHGAGMASLVLNRGLNSIIELFPRHVYHNYFPPLIGNRVASYTYIIQKYDERVPQLGWDVIWALKNTSIEVNLELLDRALSMVHNSPSDV